MTTNDDRKTALYAPHLDPLTTLLAERDQAAARASELEEKVRWAAVNAARAGVPFGRVADLVGVTRQTIYAWMREEGDQ